MRISDWSSDVCSSDLEGDFLGNVMQPLEEGCIPDRAVARLDGDEDEGRAGKLILIFQEGLDILVPRRHLLEKAGLPFQLERVVHRDDGEGGEQDENPHRSEEDTSDLQ